MEALRIVCPECNSVNTVKIKGQGEVIPCAQCKTDLDDPFPLEATDETCTTHIVENEIPILVDFYSTTCGPCMAMYDDYEDAALGFGLKVKFLKVNADVYQKVAGKYGVGALPTIIAFNKGEEISRVSRQLSQSELVLWAQSLI
ncbi:thioredoxin domain-containing protein [Sulfurimonas sp.]|jgi:thioredoxin 2|uniref:thioredoxin family protein n=1 Tax=Sulfurimonas sp. TaxID=2022749 RepID=UPI0025DF5304|nr:thioredoxin domain-containing protein [Sulfurimonas sp.]MBT5934804.1 hypothetical protein [Sulfurimonas sp.]